MSQIQNSLLHNYVQPIALMALAYVAGSKRWIQHFPGASRGGLCLAAGLGAAATLASPHIEASECLKTNKENESILHGLIRVTASLALGTFSAYAIAKSLKGRISFCTHTAGKFMGLEMLFGGVFTGISFLCSSQADREVSPEESLKEKYQRFQLSIESWNALSGRERSKWAKQFYHKDFPVLPTKGQFDGESFAELLHADLSQLTDNQIAWLTTFYTHGVDLTTEQEFALNGARDSRGLKVCWMDITTAHIRYACRNDQCLLLYAFFYTRPLDLAMVQRKERQKLLQAFNTPGLPPILSAEEFCRQLPAQEIVQLSREKAQFVSASMQRASKKGLEALSVEQQVAYNTVFRKHNAPCFWIDPLTENHLKEIQKMEGALEWIYSAFSKNPVSFAVIKNAIRTPLICLFKEKGWQPIKEAHALLSSIAVSNILSLTLSEAWDWHRFFRTYPKEWHAQCPEKHVAFNTTFSRLKIQTIKMDALTEKHVQAIANTSGAIRWVHAMFEDTPKKFGALPDKVCQHLDEAFKAEQLPPIQDVDTICKGMMSL